MVCRRKAQSTPPATATSQACTLSTACTVLNVSEWLRGIGLAEHALAFADNEMDGAAALLLHHNVMHTTPLVTCPSYPEVNSTIANNVSYQYPGNTMAAMAG